MTKLLPCPFCGTCDPHVMGPTCKRSDPYNPADRLFPTVRCRRCFVDVGGDDDDYTCATAVAKWNTRATAAPVVVGEDMVLVSRKETIELLAEAIYDQWKDDPNYVPWRKCGNSDKQYAARDIARTVLSLATMTAALAED